MSAPQYQSGEVGNVAATTVVITFDQAVDLAAPEPEVDPRKKPLTVADHGQYLVPQGGFARPKR